MPQIKNLGMPTAGPVPAMPPSPAGLPQTRPGPTAVTQAEPEPDDLTRIFNSYTSGQIDRNSLIEQLRSISTGRGGILALLETMEGKSQPEAAGDFAPVPAAAPPVGALPGSPPALVAPEAQPELDARHQRISQMLQSYGLQPLDADQMSTELNPLDYSHQLFGMGGPAAKKETVAQSGLTIGTPAAVKAPVLPSAKKTPAQSGLTMTGVPATPTALPTTQPPPVEYDDDLQGSSLAAIQRRTQAIKDRREAALQDSPMPTQVPKQKEVRQPYTGSRIGLDDASGKLIYTNLDGSTRELTAQERRSYFAKQGTLPVEQVQLTGGGAAKRGDRNPGTWKGYPMGNAYGLHSADAVYTPAPGDAGKYHQDPATGYWFDGRGGQKTFTIADQVLAPGGDIDTAPTTSGVPSATGGVNVDDIPVISGGAPGEEGSDWYGVQSLEANPGQTQSDFNTNYIASRVREAVQYFEGKGFNTNKAQEEAYKLRGQFRGKAVDIYTAWQEERTGEVAGESLLPDNWVPETSSPILNTFLSSLNQESPSFDDVGRLVVDFIGKEATINMNGEIAFATQEAQNKWQGLQNRLDRYYNVNKDNLEGLERSQNREDILEQQEFVNNLSTTKFEFDKMNQEVSDAQAERELEMREAELLGVLRKPIYGPILYDSSGRKTKREIVSWEEYPSMDAMKFDLTRQIYEDEALGIIRYEVPDPEGPPGAMKWETAANQVAMERVLKSQTLTGQIQMFVLDPETKQQVPLLGTDGEPVIYNTVEKDRQVADAQYQSAMVRLGTGELEVKWGYTPAVLGELEDTNALSIQTALNRINEAGWDSTGRFDESRAMQDLINILGGMTDPRTGGPVNAVELAGRLSQAGLLKGRAASDFDISEVLDIDLVGGTAARKTPAMLQVEADLEIAKAKLALEEEIAGEALDEEIRRNDLTDKYNMAMVSIQGMLAQANFDRVAIEEGLATIEQSKMDLEENRFVNETDRLRMEEEISDANIKVAEASATSIISTLTGMFKDKPTLEGQAFALTKMVQEATLTGKLVDEAGNEISTIEANRVAWEEDVARDKIKLESNRLQLDADMADQTALLAQNQQLLDAAIAAGQLQNAVQIRKDNMLVADRTALLERDRLRTETLLTISNPAVMVFMQRYGLLDELGFALGLNFDDIPVAPPQIEPGSFPTAQQLKRATASQRTTMLTDAAAASDMPLESIIEGIQSQTPGYQAVQPLARPTVVGAR